MKRINLLHNRLAPDVPVDPLDACRGVFNGFLLVAALSFLVVLLFLLVPRCSAEEPRLKVSGSGEKWTTTDYALEGTWMALHILDWGTTLDITNHPDKYREMNPIMGSHPSRQTVNLYMGASALLHPVVSHYLPKKVTLFGEYEIPLRTTFQAISIGVTGGCVINNFSIGLNLAF